MVFKVVPQFLQHLLLTEENSSVILLLTRVEVHISEHSSSSVLLLLHDTVFVAASQTHKLQSCLNQLEPGE